MINHELYYISVLAIISVVSCALLKNHIDEQVHKLFYVSAKAMCTVIIIIYGVFALNYAGYSRYGILIMAGLTLALIGDIALCYSFKSGMIFFLVMHLFYCAAFISIGCSFYGIIIWLILSAMAITALTIKRSRITNSVFLYYSYVAVLLLMVSLAVATKAVPNQPRFLLPVAGVLFLISDVCIGLQKMNNKSKFFDILSQVTYLSSQLLFACSIFFS